MNEFEQTVGCVEAQDWIWGTRIDITPASPGVHEHIRTCAECREEHSARGALSVDLRNLRTELNEVPPRSLDHAVLAAAADAVAARESGDHPPVQLRPLAPPPVATPRWMAAAAALLGAAVLLGFVAGRFTATGASGFAGGVAAPVHTTLATGATSSVGWRGMHRPHQVGISPDGMTRLQDGRTYLMTGPVGGPYQVVGAVRFDEVDLPSVFPRGELKEIVVAVGPSEGWQTGNELAMADLSESGAEILGRRMVEDPPVKVGFTAP
jgi:hypothetical protein